MLGCDYLIQGAGAMGMAAADVLLTETDAELLIVDRHHRPGGHWNDAYPFVRLHQPSSTYGVNSRPLGAGSKDMVGLNRGLYELASGAEVLAYFDAVMNEQFLPSARVRWLPMHERLPDGRVRSLLSGRTMPVEVRRKTFDATYLNTQVPATRPPRYAVAEGMCCLPPNALPTLRQVPDGWVVVGGGKTAMDTVLWLLQQGVEPAAVRWIMPRDSWLIDRAQVQPAPDFFLQSFGAVAAQLQAVVDADSMADLYHRLEAAGQLLRIDPAVEPAKYCCATVSQAELAQLRRITQVLRLGHVLRIERDRIVLEQGEIPTTPATVHVDCSATAIDPDVPAQPVFQGTRVVLQMVRACQPVFSAALIAHVEATGPALADEARKNELCTVVPMPGPGLKWLEMLAANMANQHRWTRDEGLARWLVASRLDRYASLSRSVGEHETDKLELLQRIRVLGGQARAKMAVLLAPA
jgi:hypothetical protein